MRQFAVAQLVHDLAGLGVAIVVRRLGLPAAQNIQRAAGEFRIDQMFCSETIRLSRPNGAMNQGSPAAGTNTMLIGAVDRQPQRRHVVDRLVVEAVKLLVAGADLQHRLLPVRQRFGVVRRPMIDRQQSRSGRNMSLAVGQRVEQAAMPGRPGSKIDLEAEPAVGIDRGRSTVARDRPSRHA